jgi:uncharacterized membrane protein
MSQFPPNPNQGPPGNYPQGNYPPGGFPPPIQPYASGMYLPPMQPRTSGAAITSLVLGLLFCVPFVTGLGAVLAGLIGLSTTRKPNVSGKGLAIAGLILGLLSVVGWGVIAGLFGAAWKLAAPDRKTAVTFVQDLCNGNNAAAQGMCSSAVTPAQVQAAVTQAQGYGTVTQMIPVGISVNSYNGNTSGIITVVVTFSSGMSHSFVVTLSHPTSGPPVVESWRIQ